jgi:hypothetical protein
MERAVKTALVRLDAQTQAPSAARSGRRSVELTGRRKPAARREPVSQ